MTAITDLWLGLGYVLTPAIWVLLRGDRKPTIDGLARNT